MGLRSVGDAQGWIDMGLRSARDAQGWMIQDELTFGMTNRDSRTGS